MTVSKWRIRIRLMVSNHPNPEGGPRMATVLDRHMEVRQFIVGDSMTIADCVTAYLMDWANEVHLIDHSPQLRAYLERMYARTEAPQRIAEAFASLQARG